MDLGKSVKILASEKAPALPSPDLSSPFSSGSTSTPTPGPGVASTAPITTSDTVSSPVTTNVLATSPPRAFSPLQTTSASAHIPFGADIELDEYLRRLLPLSHIPNTSYAQAASEAPTSVDSCTSDMVRAFADEAASSIPSASSADRAELEKFQLLDPVADVPMGPELVAKFESEQSDYMSLSKIKTQFDDLKELSSDANKQFVREVVDMLTTMQEKLKGTKNRTLERTITSIQQTLTNPHFIAQYTTQTKFPIATNPVLVEAWQKLDMARTMMDSGRDGIDRTIYGDNIRTELLEVIRLAGEVDTIVNAVLVKLEEIRREYKDFPSSEDLRATHVGSLNETHASYVRLLESLRSSSLMLSRNAKQLQEQYEQMKENLAVRIDTADREASRLQQEQNLILNAMEMLGRMYIEHELEKKKQVALSEQLTTKALTLDDEHSELQEAAARHAVRVDAAAKDTEVAIDATATLTESVNRQVSLLQRWTDEAKEQHSQQGIRILGVAHHSAVVKYDAYAEIWQVASTSLADANPELERLSQEMLAASAARFPHKVDSARRLKKELEESLPKFERTRTESAEEIKHITTQLFPSINDQLARYGVKPHEVPAHPSNQ